MGRHFLTLLTLLYCLSVGTSLHCFECSSINDAFCPEKMSDDDDAIVSYNSCDYIYEARYCVKTQGITGGSMSLECYRCDETKDLDFGCSDILFSAPLMNCDDIFEAQYCIKATGVYAGSLGTRRFCSSRDMGNYCEYINRPGDQLEYRSCVYTCTGNGCNNAKSLKISLSISVLSFTSFLIYLIFNF